MTMLSNKLKFKIAHWLIAVWFMCLLNPAHAATLNGWDKIRFGMTRAQVMKASGGLAVTLGDRLTWRSTANNFPVVVVVSFSPKGKSSVISVVLDGHLASKECAELGKFIVSQLWAQYQNPTVSNGNYMGWNFEGNRSLDLHVIVKAAPNPECTIVEMYIDRGLLPGTK